jgi:ElaB/YqjD/DUF883 family membrane-anchored ribosome-binding protein
MDEYGTTEGRSEGAAQVLKGQAEQVTEKAREIGGTVQDRVREQVDTRSTQAGDQVGSVGEAMRNMGDQLRSQGNDLPAQLAHQAAERADQLSQYLREADADRILRDAEDFGRRQPWVVAAIGLAVGVTAARFIKASGRRRYESGVHGLASPRRGGYGSTAYGTPTSAATTVDTWSAADRYPNEPVEVATREGGAHPLRGSE